MIRNKCFDIARKPAVRRSQAVEVGALDAVADRGESPSDLLAGEELLVEARRRLTDDERALSEQWRGCKSYEPRKAYMPPPPATAPGLPGSRMRASPS